MTVLPASPAPTCAHLSLQASESLPGTASHARVWLLLEHPGPWGEKALAESDLPGRVKAHLASVLEAHAGVRLLFIRQGRRQAGAAVRFFAAHARETDPRLEAFALASYDDLLEIEVPALLAGQRPPGAHPHRSPLFLVCTNGRRDPCCARLGMPLYRALRPDLGAQVWQCTHVGGHRFAANLLCFPHGLVYGRVEAQAARAIAAAYRAGRLALEGLRGRSCYPPPVQAAEVLVRKQMGLEGLSDLRLAALQETDRDAWEVRFESLGDGQLHRLKVRAGESAPPLQQSCRGDTYKPRREYRLESYRIL